MVPALGASWQSQGLGYSAAIGKASGMQSSGGCKAAQGSICRHCDPRERLGTSGTDWVVLCSLLLEPGMCWCLSWLERAGALQGSGSSRAPAQSCTSTEQDSRLGPVGCDISECVGQLAPLCAGAPGLALVPKLAGLRTAWLLCTVQSPLYCTAGVCRVMFWGLVSASRIWGVQKLDKVLLGLRFLLFTSERDKIESFFLVSTKAGTENQNWMRNRTT